MKFISELFETNIIDAIGWTLFHILWQGFLLAILLGLILKIFKNKSSQIRYALSLISLLFVVGLSIYNFTNNYQKEPLPESKNSITLNSSNQNNVQVIDFSNSSESLLKTSLFNKIEQKLSKIDRFFPIIVKLWMIGVFFFILKFIFSYLYTNRLRRTQTSDISDDWLKHFYKIESKLNIKRKIRYIESKLVKAPLMLGYLKPVVVFPIGLLTGIPTNQIEAIISHELAHIRRNDYIINVLQTIIETVFFFHPAVWYISSQIRKERENCCDDIALTVCEGSIIYAKALVSVQELSLGRQYSAVAFSGKNKKHLLNRIKRMIMKPKIKSNFTDKIIAAILIVSAITALSFTYATETNDVVEKMNFPTKIEKPTKLVKPAEPARIEKPVKENTAPIVPTKPSSVEPVIRDTTRIYRHNHESIEIDNQTVVRTYKKNGKKSEMKFTMKDGKATDLYVDGKKIAKNDYDKYQPEIDETIKDLKDAKGDIRQAMKDIEDLDLEKMQLEIQESMKDFHIDIEAMQRDIAEAMENVKEVNVAEIMENIEKQMDHLEDVDFDFNLDDIMENIDMVRIQMKIEEAQKTIRENVNVEEIRAEMERVRESINEHVDMEEIQREIEKAHKELSELNMEEIHAEVSESLRDIEKIDKVEIKKELEEKLEELEKLELEEK
jgi:beta-lactamase regulating signal transducer with metallopeptidase domain